MARRWQPRYTQPIPRYARACSSPDRSARGRSVQRGCRTRRTEVGSVLAKEMNELLCRVGPGTPCGELLRRYWMPLAPQAEVDEKGMRPLRLLGEDLLLFRDG